MKLLIDFEKEGYTELGNILTGASCLEIKQHSLEVKDVLIFNVKTIPEYQGRCLVDLLQELFPDNKVIVTLGDFKIWSMEFENE